MTSCLQCGHQDAGGFIFCPRCGTKAVEGGTGVNPLLGRILNGKYRVESEIGQGAMGTVYLGEHIGLKKRVALKVLHSDLQVSDESLQRFQREGIAAGKFNHPHAIQIFDFDKGEGRVFYLAMEYVEGSNLTLFLRQRGRLPVEVAVKLARQMLSCLAEAHRHGIVHRDLKPDNIMVTEASRGELRVKVLDFGLSKLVDRRLNSSLVTQPGRLLGTPLYMAPEQVAGDEADERSDVYAAGLILYEMLAGERPFKEKDSAQLFLTRPTAEAPSLRANLPELVVPDELEELLHRALQRERDQRYQTAEEMLNALDEVIAATGTESVSRSHGAHEAHGKVRSSTPPAPRSSASASAAATTLSAPAKPERQPEQYVTRSRLRLIAIVVSVSVLAINGGERLYKRWYGGGSAHPSRVRSIPPGERSKLEQSYVELLDGARAELVKGNVQAALSAAEQANLLDCRDAEVLLVRADAYRAKGDVDSALSAYDALAHSDPDFAEPRLAAGWIRLERGELGPASSDFDEVERARPDSAEALAGQGALAWKRGERERAGELLQQALTRDAGCAAAQRYLGRLRLDQGDAEGAIAPLVEAKRIDPRSTRTLLWLSEAYQAEERLDEADAQLQEALRVDPEASAARVERGALLLQRGRAAEALEFLVESTARAPQIGKLWILRGIAAEESGDPDAAIEALKRAFDQDTRDPDARCLLGTLYQRQKKLAEAVAQYEAVLKEEGDYPLANLDLGLALFAQGNYIEAGKRLERVLAFDEGNAVAHLELGVLYKDYLDDRDKAREHLERYRALGGEDARVADWLDTLR